jgi:hypothetical protein
MQRMAELERERLARGKDACTEIKYICVDELEQDMDRFKHAERETRWVFHSNFDELHREVFENVTPPYVCTEPIALYHQVLWSVGLKTVGGRCVRDELHHALESWEYDMLKPNRAHRDWKKPLSLCVDIVRGGPPTSFGPPSAARPAALG